MVSPWYLGGVSVVVSRSSVVSRSMQKWASKEMRNFAIGVVCWVNCDYNCD